MQKDLFDSNTSVTQPSVRMETGPTNLLASYQITLRLDQLIVIAIGLLAVFAVVFSTGVEKGKVWQRAQNQSAPKGSSEASLLEKLEAQSAPSVEKPLAETRIGDALKVTVGQLEGSAVTDVKPVIQISKAGEMPQGLYTIQVSASTVKPAADREIARLAQKGFQSFFIPSGKYLNICINGFASKSKADQALEELKSQGLAPKDAFVRNLPR